MTKLLTTTSEPEINYVKEAVFGLKGGAAISHPTLQALLNFAERESLGDADFEKVGVRWMIPLNAKGLLAGKFIGGVAKACGGGGGGRPNLAQAGGRDGAARDGVLAAAEQELKGSLTAP